MKKIINIIGKINLVAAAPYLFILFGVGDFYINPQLDPESAAQYEALMQTAVCWFLLSIVVVIIGQFSYKRFIESYRKEKTAKNTNKKKIFSKKDLWILSILSGFACFCIGFLIYLL